MPETLLRLDNLHVHYELRGGLYRFLRHQPKEILRAVDGVDLELTQGEMLGLVGESGCGKSTLGRAVVGLTDPTEGTVSYRGEALTADRERAKRRRIQMVFQDPYSSLNPRMTVKQTLSELLKAHGIVPKQGIDARCAELLDLVGLPERALDAHPRQFSGGQRQRVAIARALALEPELLIADEPVSALDVSVQATVLNLLEELREKLGLTVLLIAHNMAVVRHVADRVAVMYLGRIVEQAPTDELFTNPRHPYTQGLLTAIPRLVPGRESQSVAMAGDPPSPIDLPTGCRFHPRCPIAQEPRCSTDDPVLVSGPGADHVAACHFAWSERPAVHVPEVIEEGDMIERTTIVFEHELLQGLEHPAFIAQGKEDGPRVSLIGGIHGCEYSSIAAVTRFMNELDTSELRGTIEAVPVVSMESFRQRSPFVVPVDGKNLNRCFPGSYDGTYTDVLARSIYDRLIEPADVLLDLHGGDQVEALEPFAIYDVSTVEKRAHEIAVAFNLPYVIREERQEGGLGGMTTTAAAQAGIPGVIAEAGGRGLLEESATSMLVAGVRNALRQLGMLPGDTEPPPAGQRQVGSFIWLRSQEAGWWDWAVEAGDEVAEGQALGRIRDLLGDVREEIVAPQDGVVLFITSSPAVTADGLLLGLGADLTAF